MSGWVGYMASFSLQASDEGGLELLCVRGEAGFRFARYSIITLCKVGMSPAARVRLLCQAQSSILALPLVENTLITSAHAQNFTNQETETRFL